jgi:hypothetical protein
MTFTRSRRLLIVMCAVALAASPIATLRASARPSLVGAPAAVSSGVVPAGTIGFLYVGVDPYAVSKTGALTALPAPAHGLLFNGADVIVHTTGGASLYVAANTAPGKSAMEEFSINAQTGALTPKSPASVGSFTTVGTQLQNPGSSLIIQGTGAYASNPSAAGAPGKNALYQAVAEPGGKTIGIEEFTIDPKTGVLTEKGAVNTGLVSASFGVGGEHLSVTGVDPPVGPYSEDLDTYKIDSATGLLKADGTPFGLCKPGFPTCSQGAMTYVGADHFLLAGAGNDSSQKWFVSGFNFPSSTSKGAKLPNDVPVDTMASNGDNAYGVQTGNGQPGSVNSSFNSDQLLEVYTPSGLIKTSSVIEPAGSDHGESLAFLGPFVFVGDFGHVHELKETSTGYVTRPITSLTGSELMAALPRGDGAASLQIGTLHLLVSGSTLSLTGSVTSNEVDVHHKASTIDGVTAHISLPLPNGKHASIGVSLNKNKAGWAGVVHVIDSAKKFDATFHKVAKITVTTHKVLVHLNGKVGKHKRTLTLSLPLP